MAEYASFKDRRSESSGFRDVMVTKDGANHQVYFPDWDKGGTIFRVWPALHEGQEIPQRLRPGDYEFSWWLEPMTYVRFFGLHRKITALVDIEGRSRSYEPPFERFMRSVYNLIDKQPADVPPQWLPLIRGSKGKPAVLDSRPARGVVLQGEVLLHRAQVPKAEFASPALLVLPPTAQFALEKAANTLANQGLDPADVNSYLLGDIVSSQNGKSVLIHQRVDENKDSFNKYEVVPQQVHPIDMNKVLAEWKPWDSILRRLTPDEQVELLLQCWDAEMVSYAFRDDAELGPKLPDSVKDAWGRWQQSKMGFAAVPPGYSVPQQPQYQAPEQPQYGAVQQPQYGAVQQTQTPQQPQYQAPQYGAVQQTQTPQAPAPAPAPAPTLPPAPPGFRYDPATNTFVPETSAAPQQPQAPQYVQQQPAPAPAPAPQAPAPEQPPEAPRPTGEANTQGMNTALDALRAAKQQAEAGGPLPGQQN